MTDKQERAKKSWRRGFQLWVDRQILRFPKKYNCGYGSMCGECDLDMDAAPCLNALQRLLERHQITLDYQCVTFNEVWDGIPFQTEMKKE